MSREKILKRFRNARQYLHRMRGDHMSKAVDSIVQGGSDWVDCEPFKSFDQGMSKAVQPIAVSDDAFTFHLVENFAYLNSRILVMVQEGNELSNGPLEVNVIFPESVIGVDERGWRPLGTEKADSKEVPPPKTHPVRL